MNCVYAFAAGIVTAGVAASLFAGNPNPPVGPIGPTMVSLDQIAQKLDAQTQLLQPKVWRSAVVTSPGSFVVRTGGALVHKFALSGGSGTSILYDAATPDDRTTPIGVLTVYALSQNTAEIELSVRVTKGIMIENNYGRGVTVLYAD
jgi:hypothetical protein